MTSREPGSGRRQNWDFAGERVAGLGGGLQVDGSRVDRGTGRRRRGDRGEAALGFQEVRVRRGQDGEAIEDRGAFDGETRAPEVHPESAFGGEVLAGRAALAADARSR